MEEGHEDDVDGPDLPAALMPPDGTVGWYAYRPAGAPSPSEDDDDPVIEVVELTVSEAGPSYVMEQVPEQFRYRFSSPQFIALSDDYDELHRWLGITRRTYDAVMDWNGRWANGQGRAAGPQSLEAERQELLAAMRTEAHRGIAFV